MAQAFDGIAPDVEQLSERVRDLERRISALEGQTENARHTPPTPAPVAPGSVARTESWPQEPGHGFPASNLSAGVLPVFGKAVLGIAGAYLLRAVAEWGTLPKLALLVVAIAYSGMWLVWAFSTHATNHFASVTYAITAALILSPMLWESTVSFQVLSPVFTAAVLVAFVVLALGLAWRQNLQVIPWIATLAAVATALALIIATRDLVPFTVGLLAIALATEVTVCLGRQLTLRAVPAIAADFAVWLLVYLMTSPEGAPSEYRPIGATTITALCLALLAIYGGSIGLRSLGLRYRLTVFEIGQGVVAFVLATFGTLRASPGSAAALGGFFLLVAAVCYWGALSRFTVDVETRNRRVCATYAVALLLAGNLLLFPVSFQVPFLSLAAVAAAFLYVRTNKLSLGIHVSIYLLAAAILSGLLNLAGNALAGSVPSGLDASTWVVTASAVLCYAIGWRVSFDQWKPRLLWIVPCVLVAGVAAALAVMVGVRLGSGSGMLNASRLSVVRTLVTCSVALILGFGGSRLKHAELLWAAYLAIAFGTLKLLFEDLRFGNATSLVASLLFYGLVLILIPALTRPGRDRP
ncbi:MAG TPA: hypothetical protein VFF64_25390 [Candidatus Eremiobacteraceae bacterium]|nr:hypothetical protein [Candidatus Eremiobacteraceae bacterium]